MARRKAHIYFLGYMRWHFERFQKHLRKVLTSYPDAKMPDDLFQAFHLISLSQVESDLFAGNSVEADYLRNHLTELMVRHPEFVGAAMLFLKRKVPMSVSACIREFLLTKQRLKLANGSFVEVADATDKEISAAVAICYQLNVVTTRMVAHERQRLQKYGVPKAVHVDALLKLVGYNSPRI